MHPLTLRLNSQGMIKMNAKINNQTRKNILVRTIYGIDKSMVYLLAQLGLQFWGSLSVYLIDLAFLKDIKPYVIFKKSGL